MNRHCLDARIWGPLVVATAAVLVRGTTPSPASPTSTAHAVPLPPVHGLAEPEGAAAYEVDAARSTVRLQANGTAPVTNAAAITGRLSWSDAAQRELEFDLPLDAAHGLGQGPLVCRATLQHLGPAAVPGVSRQQWVGGLRLGDRELPVAFELWQVILPGQPLRLQGQITIPAATLAPHRHDVTLGLDLACRRQRGH